MRQTRRKSRHGTPLLRGRRPALPRPAFTIVELVIVVMLMGIMTAVAAPAFLDSLLFHRVESAARRLKVDLELARQTARLTSTAQSITFNNSTYTLSAGVEDLDRPGQVYSVDLTNSPYELDKVAADFSGATVIAFDGFGAPSAGGTVELTNKAHHCTVTVNGSTGEVTITSSHDRNRSADGAGN